MSTASTVTNDAVEAAAKAWHYERYPGVPWDDLGEQSRACCRREVRAAVEAAAPLLVPQMSELSDALITVDGYDVVEGDEVPERELWAVVNAARKVLEATPQSVDRETLEKAIEQAASEVDLAKYFLPGTTDCFVDAVLALLNGRQS